MLHPISWLGKLVRWLENPQRYHFQQIRTSLLPCGDVPGWRRGDTSALSVAIGYQQCCDVLGCFIQFLSDGSQAKHIVDWTYFSHGEFGLEAKHVDFKELEKVLAPNEHRNGELLSNIFLLIVKRQLGSQRISKFGAILMKQVCCLFYKEYTFIFLLSK